MVASTHAPAIPRRRGPYRAAVAIAASVVACMLALTSEALAVPGVPAAPVTAYDEPFENGVGSTPVLLTAYTGASGVRYTADPPWLMDCNGVVLEFAAPDAQQPASGCATALDYGNVRQMAYALGALNRAANPALNHAVSAMTEGNPGTDRVQFETTAPIPLVANGRFLTFSVDATETNCHANHALYKFYLLDGTTAIPTFTRPIEPCADPRAVDVAVPAIDVSVARAYRTGSFPSDRAVLFTGSELGIRMVNGQGSGTGNDAAFDNVRILDVTPTLDKSFSPAVLDAGQTSTLTFTITNTSELAAKPGWSFTDNLPSGLVVANPTGARTTCTNGSVTAGAGSGSIGVTGDLDAGQVSCTVSVDVTSPGPGRYTNGPGNVTSTGLNPPTPSTVHFRGADLSVVKTATATPAIPGTSISYQLVVRNDGPDTAVNARVTDALPAGLTFQSASAGCTAAGQNVTCAIGNLPAGGSQTFTVTASVGSQLDAGTIENTARTSSDTPDPDPRDNTSTTRVPVEPRADLAIVKRALSSRPVPGRNLTYELTVTNSGPSPARNVVVSDPLPRGLSFVSASEGCRFADGTVTCTLASLESGRSATFRVVTRVASSVTDNVVNTATVESSTRDPDPRNNRDTEDVGPGPEADLSITKVPSVDRVAVGGQLFYTLVIRNDGPSDAQSVVVTDTAGAGLTLLSARSSQGASCAVEANRVTCRLGTLAAGGTAQVLVSARADQVGELVNTATVESPTEDPDPRDNRDQRRVTGDPPPATPLQPADLEIVKTSNRRAALGAQTIRYTLAIRNLGPGTATGVQVIDTPSLPVRVVSVRSSVGRCTTTVPIRCDLGTLSSGARATVTVLAQPKAPGTLRNSASVTGDVPDPRAGNNIDGTATRVRGLLRVRKVASTTRIRAGGTLSYRITVTNASAFALRSVRVCDDLPDGLVFVSSTPRSRLSGGRRCWTIRTLGARRSKTITLRVRALRGAGGRKVNVATATAPGARGARSRAAADSAPIQVIAGRVRSGGVTG